MSLGEAPDKPCHMTIVKLHHKSNDQLNMAVKDDQLNMAVNEAQNTQISL